MPRTEAYLARHTNQTLKGVSFAVIGAIFWGASGIFTQTSIYRCGSKAAVAGWHSLVFRWSPTFALERRARTADVPCNLEKPPRCYTNDRVRLFGHGTVTTNLLFSD